MNFKRLESLSETGPMTSYCLSISKRFCCTFQHEDLPIKITLSALTFRYFSNIYRVGPEAVVAKKFLKMLWEQVVHELLADPPLVSVEKHDHLGLGFRTLSLRKQSEGASRVGWSVGKA